jgi:peptide deformylase
MVLAEELEASQSITSQIMSDRENSTDELWLNPKTGFLENTPGSNTEDEMDEGAKSVPETYTQLQRVKIELKNQNSLVKTYFF